MGRKAADAFAAILSLAIVFTARSAFCQEKLYQWVDDEGVVHVTSDGAKIPEAYRAKAEEKVFAPRPESVPSEPRGAAGPGQAAGVPGTIPRAAEPETMPAASSQRPAGEVDKNGHDAAWWGAKAKALHDQKKALEDKIAQAEKLIYSPRIKEKDEGHRQKDALEKDLKKANEQIDKGLAAEAAAAGADPSWIR